jgi:outer membrane receptor for ferrienterochelin and colicins
VGGNLNWVPGYTTQIDAEQAVTITSKRVWDAFALWTFNPAVGLRLLGSNLDPREYVTTTTTDARYTQPRTDQRTFERSTSRSFSPNDINWQLRLELKL